MKAIKTIIAIPFLIAGSAAVMVLSYLLTPMMIVTTIFLVFGIAPAAIGLALGLLIQGLFFAPFDLPQYGINVTTLLASILLLNFMAQKIIPQNIAYKDISYTQMLKLSVIWEGSIVSWVAFWALYGQGFEIANLQAISTFCISYMSVILVEPIIDLAILAGVKAYTKPNCNLFFDKIVIVKLSDKFY